MQKKDFFQTILDENEVKSLELFASSEVMMGAVKKVLLAGLYNNGVLRKDIDIDPGYNAAFGLVANKSELKLTNEQIGEDLCALWEGINAVRSAFAQFESFKPEQEQKGRDNPAR